jgi:hypothetical protein
VLASLAALVSGHFHLHSLTLSSRVPPDKGVE